MLDSLRTLHSVGLKEGEIFHSTQASISCEYAGGAIKTKSSGDDEGFGIRVLADKRLGFSYSNSRGKIPDAAKSAAALSKFSPQTEFSFSPRQEYVEAEPFDRKAGEADGKRMKEILLEIAEGIKKRSEPVRIILMSLVSETEIANTSLLYARERGTSFVAYAEAKNGDGFGFAQHSHYRMPENPLELGERAGLMAREMKSPKKIPPGKYSVIFSQETLEALAGMLVQSLSGELKRRRISRLWDQEGKKFFDEKLTITDDPFAEAAGKGAFDGEGVASKMLALVENGIVKNHLYSRESAALAGVEREGNCARAGYDSPPSLGPSNTVIAAGEGNPEEELRKYLFIESMHGLHTANPTSGDFGAEASIAFLFENGKKTPVRGFMVSGNVFNLFSGIESVGREQVQSGEFVSPKIAFRDVSVVS